MDANPSISVVLVCTGWREMHKLPYAEAAATEWFDFVERNHGPIRKVIEGGQRGADTLCRQEAKRRGVPYQTVKANWSLGKQAGPQRNERMVGVAKMSADLGYKIVGLAFLAPQSKGTVDMVKRMEREKWWVEKCHLPNTEMVA